MGRRTPLFQAHAAAGAATVGFAGWDLPVHFGSQVAEHHAVRTAAGMFDVSHMLVVDVGGPGARAFLRHLLANDVDRLEPGRALYTCLCAPDGGILDDLIVYRRDHGYRAVLNAARADTDLAWLTGRSAGFEVLIEPRRDLALLAVQGPAARAVVGEVLPQAAVADLRPFSFREAGDLFVARTGYTGEDGVEIALPGAQAPQLWQELAARGVQPAGLGARDTLRIEAGLNLYGNDMDEGVTPLACGLGWTVAWAPADRGFVGRQALSAAREQPQPAFLGLVLQGRGVMRAGQQVAAAGGVGTITSGTFSPTLGVSIALARLPHGTVPGDAVDVDLRGRAVPALVVPLPFVRNGRVRVPLRPAPTTAVHPEEGAPA
jgi:aminomethyltransferase